ncbi:amino acid adenylation domain-containing protein, partial [Streptomyces sp. NPDC054864]
TSGRPTDLPDADNILGLFINTIPVRTRLDPTQTTLDWLHQLQTEQWQSRNHEHLSLAQINTVTDVPAGTSLFDSLLVFENYPVDDDMGVAHGLRVRDTYGEGGSSYPLSLTAYTGGRLVGESGSGLALRMSYDPALFEAGTARALGDRLVGLLRSLIDQERLVRVPLLTDAEHTTMTRDWNDTDRECPPRLLPELFAEQAARSPEAPALISGDETLTYRQLDERANQFAHLLRDRGVGPDVLVAVSLPRGIDLVVSLLAVVKAGGAYVPVDPEYPADRIAYMLDDSGAKLLIAQDDAGRGDEAIEVVPVATELSGLPVSAPPLATRVDHAAYMIYTSGSTGRPKGVLVSHAAISNRLLWMQSVYPLGSADRVLQKTSSSFDVAVWEIFGPLVAGAGLVLARPDGHRDPQYLAETIRAHGVTTVHFVPSMLRALVAEPAMRACTGLRTVFSGGEMLQGALRDQIAEVLPQATLHNLYGPAEAAVDVTSYPAPAVGATVPIGRPVWNTKLYVLDSWLRPVPEGVAGELYVTGVQLARGYAGQAGQTAGRFVASPFGGSGERMYRTGDVVRWLPGGVIEFAGRTDDQVKMRGFRIELGEVASALAGHPAVEQAVVVVREDQPGVKRLVGYVVAEGVNSAELRDFAAAELPEYMVPAMCVVLDSLPITANGKVDRRALPEPDLSQASTQDYVAPRNETEQAVANVWADVLGMQQVGIHDNFFELGGDSILSIQVVSRLRRAGYVISPQDVLVRQTIAGVAAAVGRENTTAAPVTTVEGPVVVSPVQQWFLETHPTAPDHFGMSMRLQVAPGTDLDLLCTAVETVIRHHDGLWTTFEHTDNGWHQTADQARHCTVERLEGPLTETVQKSFRLDGGPLVRCLLTSDQDEISLLLAVHHMVVDGVSWRILLDDITTAYQQLHDGHDIALDPITTPFPTWTHKLAQQTQTGTFDDQEAYWRAVVEDTRPIAEVPAGVNTVASADIVTVTLPREQTEALLRKVPGVYRTQVNDILLAALGQTLGAWTGHHRTAVDVEGHGREETVVGADVSRTVGWFTTIYPVTLTTSPTWHDAIRTTKETLRAIPDHGIGYSALKYLGNKNLPDPAQISFNYLGRYDTDNTAGLFTAMLPVDDDRSPQDERPHVLDVLSRVVDGELEIQLQFSTAVHGVEEIRALAERYRDALADAVAFCLSDEAGGRTPSDFPLVNWDQTTLDRVIGTGPHATTITDILPLSPMQQGMLFHSLEDTTSTAYVEQMSFILEGADNLDRLTTAWQHTVDTSDALRTSVVWDQVDQPAALVHHQLRLPVHREDWTRLTDAERATTLEHRRQADRSAVTLDGGPLLRVSLADLGDHRIQVVWTFHHLLLDGWSTPRLLDDVFTRYAGGQPQPRRPYRDYLTWLTTRDTDASLAYWRTALEGFDTPVALPADRPAAAPQVWRAQAVDVPVGPEAAERVIRFARQNRLTVNAVVQGAWALLLSAHSGQHDIVFGATTSGRP